MYSCGFLSRFSLLWREASWSGSAAFTCVCKDKIQNIVHNYASPALSKVSQTFRWSGTVIIQIGIGFTISDAPRGTDDIVYHIHTILWN